jgi:hypothetical protein
MIDGQRARFLRTVWKERSMENSERQKLIADFFSLQNRAGDDDLKLIETALFVEQTFRLTLSDSDFTDERLGTSNAVSRLVESFLVD